MTACSSRSWIADVTPDSIELIDAFRRKPRLLVSRAKTVPTIIDCQRSKAWVNACTQAHRGLKLRVNREQVTAYCD